MRLYILQYGIHILTGAPVPGYLIECSSDCYVLVDTGFGHRCPKSPDSPVRARIGKEDHVLQRLAGLGIAPGKIRYLVCSHFDPDHCGAHDLFPSSEFVVQKAHYEFACRGIEPRFELQREHWDHPSLSYRLISGDVELLPGIELIETSGHVPGHQSVLVRLEKTGPVLLAIDALPQASNGCLCQRSIHRYDMNPPEVLQSARKLEILIQEKNVNMVVYGHDAAQWRTLNLSPRYYD